MGWWCLKCHPAVTGPRVNIFRCKCPLLHTSPKHSLPSLCPWSTLSTSGGWPPLIQPGIHASARPEGSFRLPLVSWRFYYRRPFLVADILHPGLVECIPIFFFFVSSPRLRGGRMAVERKLEKGAFVRMLRIYPPAYCDGALVIPVPSTEDSLLSAEQPF